MHVCVCMHVWTCMHVCMHMHTHAHMHVCVCVCVYLHYNVVDHIERKVADEDSQHVRPKVSHHHHSSNPSADTTGHNRFVCLCHTPVQYLQMIT